MAAKPAADADQPAVYERHIEGPETLLPRAEAGDLAAQLELSEAYAVLRDFKAGERWLRRAAEAGYGPAQLDLGMGLGVGEGITGRLPRDQVEGLMWLILASRPGVADERGAAISFNHFLRRKLTAEQIAEAERRAKAWVPKPAK